MANLKSLKSLLSIAFPTTLFDFYKTVFVITSTSFLEEIGITPQEQAPR